MFRCRSQLLLLLARPTTFDSAPCAEISSTCSRLSSISPYRSSKLPSTAFLRDCSTHTYNKSPFSSFVASIRKLHHSAATRKEGVSVSSFPRFLDSKKIMSGANDTYKVAFEKNSQWRRNLKDIEPELFERLGKGQAPQILWIGCADSRCPETTILGLQPGDIFCHRNIANILTSTDLNSLSVIQYAVQYLKVKHIIVCGHTSCGGVAAALDNKKLGLIDTWLMPLRHLRQENIKMLEAIPGKDRNLKLVDLNVRRSVSVLLENPLVLEAMIERDLQVHGVIYDVGTGELNELDIAEDDEIVAERKRAFKTEG